MLVLTLAAVLASTPVPLRLTADVDDAYAPLVNPGGLGLLEGAELRLAMARPRLGDRVDLGLLGAVRLGPVVLGGSAAWADVGGVGLYTPSLAFALGGPSFGIGASWTRVDAEDHGVWAAGVTWRPLPELSLAVASLDLDEKVGRRPYDVGLAARLFDARVLLSARWRIVHGLALDHDDGRPDVRMMVGVEPLDGLTVSASADLHFRPSIQIGLQLEDFGVQGGVSRLDDDGLPSSIFAEASWTHHDRPSLLARSRVVVLELAGDLTPAARFSLFAGGFDEPVYGAVPLLLHALAHEEHVDGVLLKIGSLSLGWGRLEEIRAGILGVRAAQRRVDCVLSDTTDAELYLASACDTVAVLPMLPVSMDGITGRFVFLGEALDRLGVTPEVIRRGDYKSAPEQFTRGDMSGPQREVADVLLDQAWNTLLAGVAEGRGLTREGVHELVNLGTMTATDAVARKLVDAVVYPDELEAWARKQYAGGVSFVAAESLRRPERKPWGARPSIVLITIDSTIMAGESSESPFGFGSTSGSDTLVRALDAARLDDDVKAVVLRVDSPGGDAVASELIARAVQKLDEVKPVVVSMGDVAASGGYFVAAPARVIFAEPNTITGSIGIFSLGFSVERLLSSLGVHSEALFRGEAADRGNPLLDTTEPERRVGEREIDVLYRRFLTVVAEGRGRPVEEIRKLAEGRVWTGAQARERGLVDELGGLLDALRRARVEAGLPSDARVDLDVLPSRRAGLPDSVRRLVVGTDPLASLAASLPPVLRELGRVALGLAGSQRAGTALLPFVVEVR
jgi:protease-4